MKYMPTPPPKATTPLPGQTQPAQPRKPDLSAPYRGWYPRWWLLSAIFCGIIIGLFTVFQPAICTARPSFGWVCQINTWNDWREFLVVAVIWAIFLVGWLLGFMFGVSTIEVTQPHRPFIAVALRAMSEFKTIYEPLYIMGTLAFFAIVVCWYRNWYQSTVFGYCSIVVFVAVSCFMYRCKLEERRQYFVGAGFFAIICGIVMLLFGPVQPVILTIETIIAIVGIWRIFRRPQPPANLTAQQLLAAEHAQAIAPGAVFMALMISIFRRGRP